MKRHEQVALSARVYDVRSQVEVVKGTIENLQELTELVRDGMEVTLEDMGARLQEIEEALSPPPMEQAVDVIGFVAPEFGPKNGLKVINGGAV
jgi:hypothetical protein